MLIAENAILREVREQVSGKIFDLDYDKLLDQLSTLMMLSHGQAFKRFSNALELSNKPTPKDLEKVLKRLKNLDLRTLKSKYKSHSKSYLKSFKKNTDKRLRSLINKEISNGSSWKVIESKINRAYNGRISNLNSLFRTQSAFAYSAGKYVAESSRLDLWGYRYLTKNDDRVRDSHHQFHGVTLPKDHKFWNKYYPPNGYLCRCYLKPLFRKVKIVKPPRNIIPIDSEFLFHPGKLLFG